MDAVDEFLERIRQAEHQNLDSINRFFYEVSIIPTSSTSGTKQFHPKIIHKEFAQSNYWKYVAFAFVVGLWVMCIRQMILTKDKNYASIILLILVLSFMVLGSFWHLFLNKKVNFNIYIDADKIVIGNQSFSWSEIHSTAILIVPGSKTRTRYLVIAFNDMVTYEKFDLSNFGGLDLERFTEGLSRYIEYFKMKAGNKLNIT